MGFPLPPCPILPPILSHATFAAEISVRSFCCFFFMQVAAVKHPARLRRRARIYCLYDPACARQNFFIQIKMKKVFSKGSARSGEPQMVGEIMRGMARVNTELGVDLKTRLISDVLMKPGKVYRGVLMRDENLDEYGLADPHFTFIETLLPSTDGKRNPHVFVGDCITATRREDGTLRLNFKPVRTGAEFSVAGYAMRVAHEIVEAMSGLVEEGLTRR